MKTQLKKLLPWKLSLLGIGLIISALIILGLGSEERFQKDLIQQQFRALEKKAEIGAFQLHAQLQKKQKFNLEQALYYHIYDGDRLFGWRNNLLPVGRYQTDVFPGNGLIKLKNGWYYSTTKTKGAVSCCVSFCLQNTYELQNDYLKASNPAFWSIPFQIQLAGSPKDALRDKNGKTICYVIPVSNGIEASTPLLLAPLLLLLGLCLILFNLFRSFRGQVWPTGIILLLILASRILLYEVGWPKHLLDSDWFSASFFAYDEWTPNFFEFVINGLFVGFGGQLVVELIRQSTNSIVRSLIRGLPFLFWLWIIGQINLVLEHSNIPVNFEHLFELRLSTFVFFALIGF
jgi:hypothetical protein